VRGGERARAWWAAGLLGVGAVDGASAQNVIANPEFELVDGVDGWQMVFGALWEPVVIDSDGCAESRAAFGISVVNPFPQPGAEQLFAVRAPGCLPVAPNQTFYLDFVYNAPGVDSVRAFARAYPNATCAGNNLGFYQPLIVGESFGWTHVSLSADNVIPNTLSVSLAFDAWDAVNETFGLAFDRVYLGAAERIFSEDFEGQAATPCRWSSWTP
jgi:hypothetical protein